MSAFIGYALIAIVVAAVLFYAVLAMLPGGLSVQPRSDRRPFDLPKGRGLARADLDHLRIPVTLRGYRFAETDELIDRLAAEIAARDEEIARLRLANTRPADGARPALDQADPSFGKPDSAVPDPPALNLAPPAAWIPDPSPREV